MLEKQIPNSKPQTEITSTYAQSTLKYSLIRNEGLTAKSHLLYHGHLNIKSKDVYKSNHCHLNVINSIKINTNFIPYTKLKQRHI